MPDMITTAFTCTGPYAILIMLGIKRVENRSVMPVPNKGRCAVTCNKTFNAAEYGAFVQWALLHLPPEDFERIPAWGDVKDWPGKVVGCCDYEAWDEGYPFWWDLSEVVCFDNPIPCRGSVGMWQMPPAYAEAEAKARAEKMGLWANPNPVNPYEWRRMKRSGKRTSAVYCRVLDV